MNKIFCVNCGHKNIYETQTPKFCAGCGSLVAVIGSKPKAETEEEEEHLSIEASELKVEIEGGGRLTFAEVVNEQVDRHPKSTDEIRRNR